jgi:hypothetical protein
LPSNIIWFSMSCSPRYGVRILSELDQYLPVHELLTFKDGLRVDDSIWDHKRGCQYLAWAFTIYFTFLPSGLKMMGSPVALQSFRRIVVLPALARPITRIRNRLNLARVFWISSAVSWGFDEVDIAKDALVDVNDSRLSAQPGRDCHRDFTFNHRDLCASQSSTFNAHWQSLSVNAHC